MKVMLPEKISYMSILNFMFDVPSLKTGMPESDGREVVCMTVYEIVMIVLRVISLMISLGSLLITLLTFLETRKNK